MPEPAATLRFGIPSLDQLISGRRERPGLPIEGNRPTSVCILGPDGTGKSVLGLHLAAHYAFDYVSTDDPPIVLYVSTDLSHFVANNRTWEPFGLNQLTDRLAPFGNDERFHAERFTKPKLGAILKLAKLAPLGPSSSAADSCLLSTFIEARAVGQSKEPAVGFVDLAANTAGDDWGFVNRMLASLPARAPAKPLHLMVIDAIEGFETLVGDLDAYGQVSTRRSRIAQIMRSAYNKCHVAFIVEEPKEGNRLPEEFVTDLVIRLRNVVARDYVRRTVEIEKARGQEHVRGQHPYVIRSGRGSTTGLQENPDDPFVPSVDYRGCATEEERFNLRKLEPYRSCQSYFHAFSSLHRYSRAVMQQAGARKPAAPLDQYAAFGIRYLDNMLAGHRDQPLLQVKGYDNMGLPCGTVTALIGDSLTQKTRLGRAFLSRAYANYGVMLNELTQGIAIGDLRAFRRAVDKLEKGLPRDDGVAVLLTTVDVDVDALARDFLRWLLRSKQAAALFDACSGDPPEARLLEERLCTYLTKRTICRRLEIHDLPSPILMHIVQECIAEAQRNLTGNVIGIAVGKNFETSHRIRVVIDDFSTIMDTYKEVNDDALFLPTLLFHLRREGVTTLIIDTHTGQPGAAQTEPLSSELRALVDHRLYTWRVPFYGENRVAIAAIPPLSETLIRELKTDLVIGASNTAPRNTDAQHRLELVVDPIFELYSGLEERKPEPVPLAVHLYEETQALRTYIDQENRLYQKVFAPTQMQAISRREIIIGEPSSEYDSLRDLCYVENDIRLDHTLVFQVDEFWAMRDKKALLSVRQYLNDHTTTTENRVTAGVDPFSVFQPTEAQRSARLRFERFPDYSDDIKGAVDPDRVPFVSDFGFLLCRQKAWESAIETDPDPDKKVQFVWNNLRHVTDRQDKKTRGQERQFVSWRKFLEAARSVAASEHIRAARVAPAFDLSLLAPESLTCLVLEMWASEIASGGESLSCVKKRDWNSLSRSGVIDWLTEGPDSDLVSLYDQWHKTGKYPFRSSKWLDLYKVWLLLGETLDLSQMIDPRNTFRMQIRSADPLAMAARHWYKTASALADSFSSTDPIVAVSLPGAFSVRGDWFLAISKNSRSERLGYRAIDLLSSRRANVSRFQSGIGLPTRDIIPANGYGRLRSSLFKPGDDESWNSVSLDDLRYIGAGEHLHGKNANLNWFWRSGLHDYDRHSRILQKWLYRMLVLLGKLRMDVGGGWRDGFVVYDRLTEIQALAAKKQSTVRASRGFFELDVASVAKFVARVNFLIAELKQASPANHD